VVEELLTLVQHPVSKEIVDMLTDQLAAALRGELSGAMLVVHFPGRDFAIFAAGTCKDDPTRARGTACKLDDTLAELPGR
jgi:hypothetical protein